MVELQNGCVCCGPQAGQLAPAVKALCSQAEAKGAPFDQVHCVRRGDACGGHPGGSLWVAGDREQGAGSAVGSAVGGGVYTRTLVVALGAEG